MKNVFCLMAAVTLAACSGQATDSALGISEVKITEAASTLDLVALDANHNVVGTVDLLVGPYTIVDPIDDTSVQSEGRELSVEALGQKFSRYTNTYADLHVAAIHSGDPTLNLFLSEPRISSALARWGVYFEPMSEANGAVLTDAPQAERAYISPVACHFSTSGSCGATSCAPGNIQLDGDCLPIGEREDVCCGTSHVAIARKCGSRANDSNCGAVGPNGCQVCSSTSYSSSCTTDGSGYVLQTCGTNSQYRGGTETMSFN